MNTSRQDTNTARCWTLWALAIGFFGAGAALIAAAWLNGEDMGELVVGATLAVGGKLIALLAYIRLALDQRIAPLDDTWEVGYEVGHSAGYWEGREDTRPTVVPIVCPDCGAKLVRPRKKKLG